MPALGSVQLPDCRSVLVDLAYGISQLTVELPAGTALVRPEERLGVADELRAVREALRSPVEGPALRDIVTPGARVAIAVCDGTRPQPRRPMLEAVLEEIAGTVDLDDVVVLVATGTHRGNTPAELEDMFGPELLAKVRIVNHEARDAANLVDPALSRRMVKVAGIASKIAHRATAIGHDDARRFGIAARVYDIGMLAIPAQLRERRLELSGPDAGRLLGPHVARATDVFAKERSGLIELAAIIARQHHERFDGRGYPDGLEKHDISIYAQLVAVAETFNDMTTVGPYTVGGRATPLSEKQALAYIDRQSGTAFDPEVVEGLRLVVESPAIGDPVNLASRLEGQSKAYGVGIVISETTFSTIPHWAAVEIDLVVVKGKEEAIRLYALLGDEAMGRSEAFAQFRATHREMLDAYRQRKWDDAQVLLDHCRTMEPLLGGLYDVYAARIGNFVEAPPPSDWNGVYIAESK